MIRNPLYMYPSFKNTITVDPDFNQVPFESKFTANANIIDDYPFFPVKYYYHFMYRLWKAVGSLQDCNPIVIDADELSRRPDILLRKYLKAVGFPWKEQLLTWDTGKEITRGWKTSLQRMDSTLKTWEVWYQRALESSTFMPNTKPLPSIESLTPDLQACVSTAMPYYEAMFERRIKVHA
ncbi:hypothetical protein HOLleu_34131 [Holothuria leucospilota]|uniref:Sulfotransferase n=1 Tax=Holothuria leucospilota TaxID=206669 RepID=A0A9Q0YPY5_HOLLE|nr:hypothetical protein HOLleu_34131 [Holothuria leucospilota]